MRTPASRPIAIALFLISLPVLALAQISQGDQELLRQQERERVLRQQMETSRSVRLESPVKDSGRLPANEIPCTRIKLLSLHSEDNKKILWVLDAANTAANNDADPAICRCLGAQGIATLIGRIQNTILQRGFITTRVLAAQQDLQSGTLTLTLLPGRIRQIRFAEGSNSRATKWNAVPAQAGDLLNLRDIEQALENFKRIPSADADIHTRLGSPISRPHSS
jgi:hemolysin activation/secretion protein